jgi:hypothetical protein
MQQVSLCPGQENQNILHVHDISKHIEKLHAIENLPLEGLAESTLLAQLVL